MCVYVGGGGGGIPGGQLGTCLGPEAGGRRYEKSLEVGPLQPGVGRGRPSARCGRRVDGGPQRRSGGCERDSGREVASQMVVFLFLFSILMKMNLQNE